MPIDNKIDLTLDELKTIIHGLRMSTLSFVEDNAIGQLPTNSSVGLRE